MSRRASPASRTPAAAPASEPTATAETTAETAADTTAPEPPLGPNDGTAGGTGTVHADGIPAATALDSDAGSELAADAAVADPAATTAPEPPHEEAEPLRTDGPTPAEWVAAGYAAEHYPPAGYAAKTDDGVRYFRVTEHCRYFQTSGVSTFPKGHVISTLGYNLDDVRAQGVPLEPCTAADIPTAPGIGHRSV